MNLKEMKSKAEAWLGPIFCSKAIYVGLALVHGAGCVGVNYEAVHVSVTVLYAMLVVVRH